MPRTWFWFCGWRLAIRSKGQIHRCDLLQKLGRWDGGQSQRTLKNMASFMKTSYSSPFAYGCCTRIRRDAMVSPAKQQGWATKPCVRPWWTIASSWCQWVRWLDGWPCKSVLTSWPNKKVDRRSLTSRWGTRCSQRKSYHYRGGVVGTPFARIALGLGSQVTILDISAKRLSASSGRCLWSSNPKPLCLIHLTLKPASMPMLSSVPSWFLELKRLSEWQTIWLNKCVPVQSSLT